MSYISRSGVEEITGWEEKIREVLSEKNDFYLELCSGFDANITDKILEIANSAIASAVEAERAKWVFASDGVRKTMTELFLQDKQNEQINPSKK